MYCYYVLSASQARSGGPSGLWPRRGAERPRTGVPPPRTVRSLPVPDCPHARTDDGGVGVNVGRSGVARRRPGAQSSNNSPSESAAMVFCVSRPSSSSVLSWCVCAALPFAALLACLCSRRAARSTACADRFLTHLLHCFARRHRSSQMGFGGFFSSSKAMFGFGMPTTSLSLYGLYFNDLQGQYGEKIRLKSSAQHTQVSMCPENQ